MPQDSNWPKEEHQHTSPDVSDRTTCRVELRDTLFPKRKDSMLHWMSVICTTYVISSQLSDSIIA